MPELSRNESETKILRTVVVIDLQLPAVERKQYSDDFLPIIYQKK